MEGNPKIFDPSQTFYNATKHKDHTCQRRTLKKERKVRNDLSFIIQHLANRDDFDENLSNLQQKKVWSDLNKYM